MDKEGDDSMVINDLLEHTLSLSFLLHSHISIDDIHFCLLSNLVLYFLMLYILQTRAVMDSDIF